MIKKVVFALSLSSLLSAQFEEKATKRLSSHLLLKDPVRAVEEGTRFLSVLPDSISLQKALLCALCARGEEILAMEFWKKLDPLLKNDLERRSLLEKMGWGTLKKGLTSSQQGVRMQALVGASLTRDARAVFILQETLSDSSAPVRSLAAGLASRFGDYALQEAIFAQLKREPVWYARVALIKALGNLRMREATPYLEEIVANPRVLADEKAAAIIALTNIDDRLEKTRLKTLLGSNRAGMRQLAAHLISHFGLSEWMGGLFPLLADSRPEVRLSALMALAFLPLDAEKQKIALTKLLPLCQDSNSEVTTIASWLAMRWGSSIGQKSLEKQLYQGPLKVQRIAAAALAATGFVGEEAVRKAFSTHTDPFVRANLSFWFIGHRSDELKACDELFTLFEGKEESWSWEEGCGGLFRSLSPSKAFHIEAIPSYPLVVDQLVCLEILSILSKLRYPKADLAVQKYLKSSDWGVMGSAAVTLLQEGDSEALALVEKAMESPDEIIRLQAALVLAYVGSDRRATPILEKVYQTANRARKEQILEALAAIGDPASIPFLTDVLKEPFQNLRVVAASALVQCLNN